MSLFARNCYSLAVKDKLSLQKAAYSNKKWPDDKWILMNGLRGLGRWWQSNLERMDKYCACLPNMYPKMPPETDPNNKLEAVKKNLQPAVIKYWCTKGFCTVRGTVVSIQSMDWHVATHGFIMHNIRKSVSTTKSFLERHLLEEVPDPVSSTIAKEKRAVETCNEQPLPIEKIDITITKVPICPDPPKNLEACAKTTDVQK